MVYFMENPIKIDDLGGNTPILGITHIVYILPSDTGQSVNARTLQAKLESFAREARDESRRRDVEV